MTFLESLRERARARTRTLVFPEGDDPRTQQAAVELVAEGLVTPVLLGSPRAIRAGLEEAGGDPDGITVHDPADPERLEEYLDELRAVRRFRDLDDGDARERAADPLFQGALMVRAGRVDGSVAGAVHATPDVLRAGIFCVGAAEGIRTVSSSFYMVVQPFRTPDPEVLTFSDAGMVPDPDAEELAEIAVAASRARSRIVGDDPRVAFLSYSTRGSAGGPSVTKVREALERFRGLMPDVPADGELQADAALVADVARRKAPDSPVGGSANVLIFPDLDAGNIAYKLVQRLGRARALGPIVQGLARPCCDLSRGATAGDIVNVACITALLAE